VLDLNFSEHRQPLGGFVAFDAIVAHLEKATGDVIARNSELPWKEVYIASVWGARSNAMYQVILDEIKKRNAGSLQRFGFQLKPEKVFAMPDHPYIRALSREIYTDYQRSVAEQGPH